eukprot:scaffold118237_cov47-Cyclotella_meneghiniana.AAC.1
MSTSRSEGATSNKRTRNSTTASDSNNAGSAGVANAAATIDARLGTRLLPIKPSLVSQPTELQGTIISLCKEMLETRDAIKQRKTSYARYDQPSKDPTTGNVVKDKEGNPLPFVPGALREKCPLKASTVANNDATMTELMENARKEHAAYIVKMTAVAKSIAAREIAIREEILRSTLYKLINKIALASVIREEMSVGLPANCEIGRQEFVGLIALAVVGGSPATFAAKSGMDTAVALADDCQKSNNYPTAMPRDEDMEFLTPIVTKLLTDVPNFTTALWNLDDERDVNRKINAEIKKELEKAAIVESTEDVEDELDAIDLTDAPKDKLRDFIDKRVKEGLDKKTVQFKKAMRKNSSGEAKTQTSRPTASGTKSKNNSAKQQSKQGTNPKSKDQTPTAEPRSKKQRSNANAKNHNQRNVQNAEKAGGSNGGGKKRGAGRR